MNYKLSVFVNRPKGSRCYVAECNGYERVSDITSCFPDCNIKKETLIVLKKGLLAIRGMVKHEDLVLIEISNQHLHRWLDERIDYKGYNKELDDVFSVLETLDCRYRFVFKENPYAKDFLERNKRQGIIGSSIGDMFESNEDMFRSNY